MAISFNFSKKCVPIESLGMKFFFLFFFSFPFFSFSIMQSFYFNFYKCREREKERGGKNLVISNRYIRSEKKNSHLELYKPHPLPNLVTQQNRPLSSLRWATRPGMNSPSPTPPPALKGLYSAGHQKKNMTSKNPSSLLFRWHVWGCEHLAEAVNICEYRKVSQKEEEKKSPPRT